MLAERSFLPFALLNRKQSFLLLSFFQRIQEEAEFMPQQLYCGVKPTWSSNRSYAEAYPKARWYEDTHHTVDEVEKASKSGMGFTRGSAAKHKSVPKLVHSLLVETVMQGLPFRSSCLVSLTCMLQRSHIKFLHTTLKSQTKF